MKASVETFKAGLRELTFFLTNSDREADLVRGLLGGVRRQSLSDAEKGLLEEIAAARTDKKRYVYAVGIIGLYGLLERFVDGILVRYVQTISSLVNRYDDLPEAIRRNHIPLSIELLKAVNEERHRGDLKVPDIIANLHSCLSAENPFRVNGAAFVLHRGNISLTKLRDYLATLGIDAFFRRLLVMPAFERFYADVDPPRDVRGIQDSSLGLLLEPIDDLVERRNLVSHGIINEIETVELLLERCGFVAAFVDALCELLQQEVLRVEISQSTSQALGNPLNVYDNRIVCFEAKNCRIAVGDRLVAVTGDVLFPFRSSAVINLEVDRQRYPSLEITTATQFGVEVQFKAQRNQEYFVLRAEGAA